VEIGGWRKALKAARNDQVRKAIEDEIHLDAAFSGTLELLLEPLAKCVVLPDKRFEDDPLLCLLYGVQHRGIQVFTVGVYLYL
jgi:hypothetical protein